MTTAAEHLEAIFQADRAAAEAEAELMTEPHSPTLVELLTRATEAACKSPERGEAILRLERLADLCAQVPGPAMVDALLRILDDDEPSVRAGAGEALLDVAYERYAEVARAVERALECGMDGPAGSEVPWIIAEIGEPSALALLRRFLTQKSPETVAAAIEAMAVAGDPAAVKDLERLVDDKRIVTIDDLDEEGSATLGELATEAIEELSGRDEP
jgi:HEAT repeat protein